jgi:uncharacterized protein involved in outer membrane biogenesis
VSSQDATSDATSRARLCRLLVWVFAGLIAAVELLVVVAAVALRTVDLSRFAGTITAAVKRDTGRDLTVGRGPYARLSLAPTVVLEDVALSNAPWGSRKEMLRVKRVELRLQLLALLHGEVLVARFALGEPDLLLETNAKGEGNWSFAPVPGVAAATDDATGKGSLASRLGIREVRVTEGVVAYRDGCTGWRVGAMLRNLALVPQGSARGDLEVDGTLTLERATVSVSGMIGGVDALSGADPFPVRLAFATPGATFKLEGDIRRVRELAGVELGADLAVSDPSALAALLGAAPPVKTPFRVEARLRDSGKSWMLDSIHATAGKSEVLGSVSYASGCPRSAVAVVLRAPLLDLAELVGSRASPPAPSVTRPPRGGKLFPAAPLPLDVLKALDATADVRADALVLPSGAEVRSLAARAVLTAGRLTVNPLSMEIGKGRISGSLRLEAGRRPSFAATLAGRDVELRELLGLAAVRADVSGGSTELAVALAGSGGSLRDWMAGLTGNLRFVVGPARVGGAALSLGGDVLAQALDAVNPARKTDTSTEIRCMVINVPVEGGMVRLDRRVAVETSQINMVVEGTADLRTEMLDVGFRSRATRGLGMGLANFAGAVRIRGPFTDPALALDAEGTAQAANTIRNLFKTRGRSLFQDRVQDMLTATSPCKEALGEAAPSRPWPLNLFRER